MAESALNAGLPDLSMCTLGRCSHKDREEVRKLKTTGIIALAAVFALSAAEAQTSEPAATVNGAQITNAQVDAQLDVLVSERAITDAQLVEQLRGEVVEQLITQQLLWQAADIRGYSVDDSAVDQRIEALEASFPSAAAYRAQIEASGFNEATFREDMKQRIAVEQLISRDIAPLATVRDDEIDAFYTQNIEAMKLPEEIRARHILIRVQSDGEVTETEARQEIEAILAEARAGASFADLAMKHSDEPTAAQGGDLGYIGHGQLIAPLERAAFALQPGEFSDVIRTQLGFHIIAVEARRGGEPLAKGEVSESIATYLRQQRMQSALAAFIQDLRSLSEVTVLLDDGG